MLRRLTDYGVTLSKRDRDFLAGMLQARGKCYVGSTERNGKTKWSPSLSLEVSGDPAQHWPVLIDVFGTPHERRYYAKPSWRYVTQDRERIAAIIGALNFEAGFASTAETMALFCLAQNETQEKLYATRLRDVADE